MTGWWSRRAGMILVIHGNGATEEEPMADVTCPLTREELAALLADGALPPELRVVLEDPARTIELGHGYAMELPEAEARSLMAHAASHDLRVAAALREELAGYEKRKREGGR